MYELIYFHLIDSKRLLAIDLFAISLRCSPGHLYCVKKYPIHEDDSNSFIGQCVLCTSLRSLYLAGIKGKFQSNNGSNYRIRIIGYLF